MNKELKTYLENLKNKKIAIIGAGVSNLPLLTYFSNRNLNITLFEKNTLETLNESTKKIIQENNIKTFLGENYLENLQGFDIIYRSPSLLPTNPYLKKEQEKGAIITTEIEQVIKLSPCKVIGITGSKGKTTTSTMIYEFLKNMGYTCHLGGNIGTPLFTKLETIKKNDIIILELSSFQLMNMTVSPNISLITNISPDHLDVHSSYTEYINAKKAIYLNQTKEDILILNDEDALVKECKNDAKTSNIIYFGTKDYQNNYILNKKYITYQDKIIIDTTKLTIKGKHNYLNMCAALNTIKDYINITTKELEQIAINIKSVPHRLEYIRTINQTEWYNDSASTSPDKALGALNAFDKDIILIAGGSDKNISYEPLAKPILEKVSKLILFGSTKTKIYDAVMNEIKKNKKEVKTKIYILDTIEEVVEAALRLSTKDEVVVFSPASASFDMFNNAYERGDIFKKLVNNI